MAPLSFHPSPDGGVGAAAAADLAAAFGGSVPNDMTPSLKTVPSEPWVAESSAWESCASMEPGESGAPAAGGAVSPVSSVPNAVGESCRLPTIAAAAAAATMDIRCLPVKRKCSSPSHQESERRLDQEAK